MTDDRPAFEAAIAAAPGDEGLRRVYADWLDEHDEPEHAAFQRAWTAAARDAALAWMADFAAGHFNYDYGTDEYAAHDHGATEYTAADMIAAGHRRLAPVANEWEWTGTTQYGSQSLQDELYGPRAKAEWWRQWSLATGVYVPEAEAEDLRVFGCSC